MSDPLNAAPDPMEMRWLILPLLGNPDADVCIGIKYKSNWWIMLKDVPKSLADHITELHNKELFLKELFLKTGREDDN